MKKVLLFAMLLIAVSAYSKTNKKEVIIVEEEKFNYDYTNAYFDKNWNRTLGVEGATFYRDVTMAGDLYFASDYYINPFGIQGTGYFRTLENEEREGRFRFYYPNGVLQAEGDYKDNAPIGEWRLYYENGKLGRIDNYGGVVKEDEVIEIGTDDDYAVIVAVVEDEEEEVEIDPGYDEYYDNYYTEAYFDKDWNRVFDREDAVFYRRVIEVGSLYFVSDYYISTGSVQGTGYFRTLTDEEREGRFRFYYPNGMLESEGQYEDNEPIGEWRHYYEDGKLRCINNYYNGEYNGDYISFHPNGRMKRHEIFENHNSVSGVCFNKKGKMVEFYPLCQPPVYPGKEGALYRDVQKNREKELAKGISKKQITSRHSGLVYVRADVSKKGKLENIAVFSSEEPALNDTAIRIVKKLKKFRPCLIDGEPVEYTNYGFRFYF